jgi:thiol-disulfide isomerase/thioredoxin
VKTKYLPILIILFSGFLFAQERNKIKKDLNSEPMLIGYCTREVFSDSVFAAWFKPEYESYKPDSSNIEALKKDMGDIDITIVMGSWCSDSQWYVPDFYKVLDEADYPSDRIKLIAVDEDKKTEGDEIDSLSIKLVPAFIFYKNSSELGRIVESPEKSLEEDILKIVSK